MITDEELGKIEARAEMATDGPWEYDSDSEAIIERASGGDEWICQSFSKQEDSFLNGYGNGEFIARARTDIPRLVAEVRRLKSELESKAQGV